MNYLRLLFLLPALATLAGCESPDDKAQQQAAAAEQAVLARHDELMAQMDQLTLLRLQLQKTPGPDTLAAGRHRRALLAADAAMMDWMHRYRKPADTAAVERRLAYFAGQQHQLDSVAVLFRSSLDSARRLLPAGGAAASSASSQ